MIVEMSDENFAKLLSLGYSVQGNKKQKWLVSPTGHRSRIVEDTMDLRLYVIRARRSTRFKIGLSINPKLRMRELQVGSAVKLEMVCAVSIESPATERLAHDIMRQHHSHGEWFDLGRRAEAFCSAVATCETADQALDLLERFGQKEQKENFIK